MTPAARTAAAIKLLTAHGGTRLFFLRGGGGGAKPCGLCSTVEAAMLSLVFLPGRVGGADGAGRRGNNNLGVAKRALDLDPEYSESDAML